MNEYIKRYKLSKEQAGVYEWVKAQNINTDDNTICYWAKTYDPKRIKDVINFANSRIEGGQEIRNIGGWIQKLLKTGFAVVNENCKANREFVDQFLNETRWNELRIYEKYVKDTVTEDDLPLTIDKSDFKRALAALYQKSQLYK